MNGEVAVSEFDDVPEGLSETLEACQKMLTTHGIVPEVEAPFLEVTDDEATVRATVPELLERQGEIRVVAVVDSGNAAIETLRQNPNIELALLDVDIQGIDGI